MSIIRFNNGSGYFSGDISANDVSFNNVDIEENLKVRNNLEVIGDISANDASFNNVDIEENLRVINNLEVIGDISANDTSFNNINTNEITIKNVKIGSFTGGNNAVFSHKSYFNNLSYAFAQSPTGITLINSATDRIWVLKNTEIRADLNVTKHISANDASFNKINVKDLVVDGSLNVNNYIYNNIEVQNKTIFSTSIDISNAGTGPALKVTQYGSGNGDSVALFNAGSEGDSMQIDYKGDINMYKNVDIYGDISANDASFNNVEIKTDLNDIGHLIKYVSGNSYIWSDNNVEEVARNDASFNVVVWRRV